MLPKQRFLVQRGWTYFFVGENEIHQVVYLTCSLRIFEKLDTRLDIHIFQNTLLLLPYWHAYENDDIKIN